MPPKKRKIEDGPQVDISTPQALRGACVRLYEIKDQLLSADAQIAPMQVAAKQLEDAIAKFLIGSNEGHIDVDDARQIVLSTGQEDKPAKPNAKDYEDILPHFVSPEVLMQMNAELMRRLQAKKKKPATPSLQVKRMQMVDL